MREQFVKTNCLQCVAGCGIIVHVVDDIIRDIEGNPEDNNNRGKMCAKGQAGLRQAYDPERIKTPLERIGPRGSGQWKSLSWDEALDKVAAKLKEIKVSGHPEGFVFQTGRNMQAGYTTRFAHAFGTPNHFNHDSLCANSRSFAAVHSLGDGWPLADMEYAKYIMIFGSNPLQGGIPFVSIAQRIVEARSKGARIIVIDPRFTMTAAKADEWISIKPGTDGALAMGMIHYIVQQQLYDKAFVQQWCHGFQEFVDQEVEKFPPEKAAKICGIDADKIRELALDFASTKPAVADLLRGVCAHQNGFDTSRAVLTLNALVGNIDIKGGLCFSTAQVIPPVLPIPPAPNCIAKIDGSSGDGPFSLAANIQHLVLPAIGKGKPYPIKAMMLYHSSPAYSIPEPDRQITVLKDEEKLPLLVSIDPFMGETTALADIILPEATYLERLDLVAWPFNLNFVPYLFLRKPVIKPQHGSRTLKSILRDLALRIGEGMEVYFQDDEITYHQKELAAIENAPSWEQMMEQAIWYPHQERKYKRYEEKGFATPSGKFEILSQTVKDKGHSPFPTYTVIKDHETNKNDYPFHLITYKLAIHNQSRTANIPELMEIQGENFMVINEQVAAKLDISSGDLVKVESPVGEIEVIARVTPGINPDVVAISHHFGHWEYGKTAKGKGVTPNWVIQCKEDPISGQVAYNDTMCRIKKQTTKTNEGGRKC